MMVEYKILSSGTDTDLERLVNEHLADGWRLCGGVSVSQGMRVGCNNEYTQAIFKEQTK